MSAREPLYFVKAPASRLATLRIALGAYALVYVVGRFGHLVGVRGYPASQFDPVGPVAWLQAPLPSVIVVAAAIVCVLAGVAFVAGWRFAVMGPVFAVALLWVTAYRNSWGMVFHTENLLAMHILVLALAPSADAWSVHARVEPDTLSERYGWAIRLLCLVTVVAYFIAGFTKLRHAGFEWVWGDALRNHVAYDNVRKIELGAGYSVLGGMLVRFDWLFPPLAALSMLIEIGAPLAWFFGRWDKLWVALAWGFHAGVLALMFIFFHYPLLGFAYASFFEVEKPADSIRKWWIGRRARS